MYGRDVGLARRDDALLSARVRERDSVGEGNDRWTFSGRGGPISTTPSSPVACSSSSTASRSSSSYASTCTSSSSFPPSSTSTGLASLESLPPLLLFGEEVFLALLLFSSQLFFRFDSPYFGFLQILLVDPFRVCTVWAGNDIVLVRGPSATVGTEAGKIERAQVGVFDVTQAAMWPQWTEAPCVMRTRGET